MPRRPPAPVAAFGCPPSPPDPRDPARKGGWGRKARPDSDPARNETKDGRPAIENPGISQSGPLLFRGGGRGPGRLPAAAVGRGADEDPGPAAVHPGDADGIVEVRDLHGGGGGAGAEGVEGAARLGLGGGVEGVAGGVGEQAREGGAADRGLLDGDGEGGRAGRGEGSGGFDVALERGQDRVEGAEGEADAGYELGGGGRDAGDALRGSAGGALRNAVCDREKGLGQLAREQREWLLHPTQCLAECPEKWR